MQNFLTLRKVVKSGPLTSSIRFLGVSRWCRSCQQINLWRHLMAGELEVGLGWLTKCNFALIQLVRLDVLCVEIGVTTARCRLQIFDYSRVFTQQSQIRSWFVLQWKVVGSLPYWYTGYTQYPEAKWIIYLYTYICAWIKKNSNGSWGQPMPRRRRKSRNCWWGKFESIFLGQESLNIRLFEKKQFSSLLLAEKLHSNGQKWSLRPFFLLIGDIWYIWFINVVLDFHDRHQKYPFWEWGKGGFSLVLSGLVYHNPQTDLHTVGWGKRYHCQDNNQVLQRVLGVPFKIWIV